MLLATHLLRAMHINYAACYTSSSCYAAVTLRYVATTVWSSPIGTEGSRAASSERAAEPSWRQSLVMVVISHYAAGWPLTCGT